MAPTNETYNRFLADLTTSQKFLTGDWFVVPEEGKIYNRFHAEVKGCLMKDGYRLIGSKFWGEDINIMHHRAVWIGAHGGIIPDPALQIDHINGIKDDNRISNLRLVTPKENCNNPNTLCNMMGERNHNSKVTDKQRKEICEKYELSKTLPKGDPRRCTTRSLSFEYGITHQQIALIIKKGSA